MRMSKIGTVAFPKLVYGDKIPLPYKITGIFEKGQPASTISFLNCENSIDRELELRPHPWFQV